MNRSTKYVKNQELKRFNNIKGKKKYLLISKVMNRYGTFCTDYSIFDVYRYSGLFDEISR